MRDHRAWVGAVAGLVSGALAVGVGMFLAAATGVVSPIDAVGSEVIDRAPLWLKEFAIETFGTNDKVALRIGIIVLLAVAAALIGVGAMRHAAVGIGGFTAFGLVGAFAAAGRPGEAPGAAVPSIVGAVVGCLVLLRMVRPRAIEVPGPSRVPLGWDRRRFLIASGVTAAAAAALAGTAGAVEGNRTSAVRRALHSGVLACHVALPRACWS